MRLRSSFTTADDAVFKLQLCAQLCVLSPRADAQNHAGIVRVSDEFHPTHLVISSVHGSKV